MVVCIIHVRFYFNFRQIVYYMQDKSSISEKKFPEWARIKQIMSALGIESQSQFEEILGTQNTLKQYFSPPEKPKRRMITLAGKLSKSIGVSFEWFLTGEGEMFASDIKNKPRETSHYEKLGRAVQELVSEAVKVSREKHPSATEAESPEKYPSENASIPLFQHLIAAGSCVDSSGPVEKFIDFPRHMIPHPIDTYALKVTGDSMKGDNIEEGDILIVDCSLEPQHNNIVIASVDNEQTVKRLKMNEGKVMLMPSNHHYDPIEITEHTKFDIQGVVTWVIRNTA